MKNSVSCPICKNTSDLDNSNKFRPFCSERCRLIDLGKWADEDYSITDKSYVNDEEIPPEIH